MKIAILCDSILLEKSLQSYLRGHIVTSIDADFIICDKMVASKTPIFLIGHSSRVHLRVPFTKLQLFGALENFYDDMIGREISLNSKDQMKPFIEKLNKRHHEKIAKLARKF